MDAPGNGMQDARGRAERSGLGRVAGPEERLVEFGAAPVLECFWPGSDELNARLRDVILARMAASQGLVDTNVGGWHSERDLASWTDPSIAALLDRVRAMARRLVAVTVRKPIPAHLENWAIEAWANVNRRGAFNKAHHHAGGLQSRNLWSGIYYVDNGDPAESGAAPGGLTKFEDRSGVAKEILDCRDPFERELTIIPRPGLMVFFPATLRHYVSPYTGSGDRITIAFNLKHEGFVIPRYPEEGRPSFLWRNFRGPMLVASRLAAPVRRLFDHDGRY
jgi:uncharacterized protein (TIGR02466 family)